MQQQADYPHNHADIIAAIDAGRGLTDQGFTFLKPDSQEDFFSWDRLRTEAMNRAAHFRALGLKKGDRLAMVLPDGQDFVPTFLGAAWAGIVPVPLYPPLSLGKLDSYIEALIAIMNKAGPTYLATNTKLETILWSAASKVPSLKGVITAETLRTEAPESASREKATVGQDDIVFLQFTSGSTSLPKGVEVTHGSLRANSWAIIRDGLRANSLTDCGVSWLPLYHDMGLIGHTLAPVFHKIRCVFIPTMSFVRNATIWLDTIHKRGGTLSFAPNFAYALAVKRAKPEQLAKWDLSKMRVFGCGAEPIHPDTIRSFTEKFAACGLKPTAMLPCYGMAEATLALSFTSLDEPMSTDVIDRDAYQTKKRAEAAHVSKLESKEAFEFVCCGKTFPGHELGIFSPDGERLGDRQIGEVWAKGPSIAAGYFKDPEASAKTFGNGWLRTGDLGYLVNGNLYLTGRAKDLIIVNGRNYDPSRIEWLADEVPGVRKGSTVAFSVPGATSEDLILVVESRAEDQVALKDALRQVITEQMQLTVAEVVIAAPGSLPKTSSGKVQRSKTRQQYLDGTVGKEGSRTLGAQGEKLMVARHVARSLVGRAKNRAKRVASHTSEIRNLTDAAQKLRLVGDYAKGRVTRLFS